MRYQQRMWILGLLAALSVAVAGCANSPAEAPTGPPSTTAASPTADPTVQITANWEEFFDSKTSLDRRVQLLQNGPAFTATIAAQASNPLAATATVQVSKVNMNSPQQASVTYSILVGGTPALANQNGIAVLEDGTWKVSAASFCGLLTLENGGPSGLPAPCAPSPQTT